MLHYYFFLLIGMETFKVILKEDEDNGVYAISHVLDPAIDSMYVFMKNEKEVEIQLATVSEEKRIVVGAVLIPNQLILRKEPKTGNPFNIFFDSETIKHIQENFVNKSFQNNSTLEHDGKLLPDVTFVETWIKEDDVHDKSVLYGFDLPVGTMFAMQKVNNDELWEDYIKTGKVKGFSIDGVFDLEKINLKSEYMDFKEVGAQIIDAIKNGFAEVKLTAEVPPVEITQEPIELAQMKLKDGVTTIEVDKMEVGGMVTIVAENGDKTPATEGEYDLEDGSSFTVDATGMITEVKAKEEEVVEDVVEIPVEMSTEEMKATIDELKLKLADVNIPPDLAVLTRVVKMLFMDRFQWQIQQKETEKIIEEFSTSMAKSMATITAQEIQSVKTELTKQIADAKNVVVELSSETKAIPEVTINLSEMSPVQRFRAGKVELK
jgi:hypothetical protein